MKHLPVLVLLLILLAACNALPGAEPTASNPPTLTPLAGLTATAAATQAAPTSLPATTPTLTPIVETPAAATPTPIEATPPAPSSLTYALGTIFDEMRGWVLRGLVPANGGWEVAELVVPAGVEASNLDYDPLSNRGLVWVNTAGVGSGPGNLATGPLVVVDFARGTAETVIPERVVSARWEPNGRGYAYLLATDTTYELHVRDAAGGDRLLAADIPREFTFDPAGTAIAFTRESGYNLPATPGLYVVDLESGEERQLGDVDRNGMGGIGAAWAPLWSPGGESLLLHAYADASERVVWADAAGAWNHAVTLSAIDAAAGQALGMENVCNNMEFLLIGPTTLVTGAGPCAAEPLMGALPEATHLVTLELDPTSGALTPAGSVPAPTNIFTFVDWDAAARTVIIAGPPFDTASEAFVVQL